MSTTISTFNPKAFVRSGLRDLPEYVPSRPAALPDRLIRLDMNESPYGPSPKARAALLAFDQTHRYPDFGQSALLQALSRYTGVPPEQIVAGAGLDDVLTTLANLILEPGDEVIISEPTFGVYRVIVSQRDGVTVDVPLTADFQLDPDAVLAAVTARTKLIVICTPNNPTGNLLDETAVERICAEAPCLIAIDEAYAEFAAASHISFLDRHPNVMIFRTMSKFAGLAGMRVGYGLFPTSLAPFLHHVTPPFHNVSVASSEAVIASLDDLDHLRGIVARIVADRETLSDQLREIPGVSAYPSATNFLLVGLPTADAAPVVAQMARRGVLVRHFARPELAIRHCLRVTIGTTEENEFFLRTLADVLAERQAPA
ncbi:MAG: histidinol-phosphate transaminase [Thermomicrobiales bacterium]